MLEQLPNWFFFCAVFCVRFFISNVGCQVFFALLFYQCSPMYVQQNSNEICCWLCLRSLNFFLLISQIIIRCIQAVHICICCYIAHTIHHTDTATQTTIYFVLNYLFVDTFRLFKFDSFASIAFVHIRHISMCMYFYVYGHINDILHTKRQWADIFFFAVCSLRILLDFVVVLIFFCLSSIQSNNRAQFVCTYACVQRRI